MSKFNSVFVFKCLKNSELNPFWCQIGNAVREEQNSAYYRLIIFLMKQQVFRFVYITGVFFLRFYDRKYVLD